MTQKAGSRKILILAFPCMLIATILACRGDFINDIPPQENSIPTVVVEMADRETIIPANAVKILAETDEHPPQLFSSEFESPAPVNGEVNTAGAEDSPFISIDGNVLYFFFTPDVNVPVEKQILDGATGIYQSDKIAGVWGKPKRIILHDAGKISGDGCEFILGELMYFCTVREGYTGMHWFTAEKRNGEWQNWKNSDFNPNFEVGELHITSDGTELYFGSERSGGKGNLDIWVSKKNNGTWQEPINIAAVNTIDSEGWPAVNPAGDELWFSRNYDIWRSKKVNGAWQEPLLIVSPLAGEPSIDNAGNLYFVHHFYQDDQMIEADIYVAHKK